VPEALLQSLRAAGLLSSNVSTAPSIPQINTIQPLAVNSNSANLRNSDLELTNASLQKYNPFVSFTNVDHVPISLIFCTIRTICNVVHVLVDFPTPMKDVQNVTPISTGIFASTNDSAKISAAARQEHGILQKRYLHHWLALTSRNGSSPTMKIRRQ
jgi:hypothetical protein